MDYRSLETRKLYQHNAIRVVGEGYFVCEWKMYQKFSVYKNSRARGLTKDLYAKAKLYVLRNFENVVAKSDELLQISKDEMYHIMNNDMLNIKDEALAWEGILRWVKFDVNLRMQHVPMLLTTVRLGILQFQVRL